MRSCSHRHPKRFCAAFAVAVVAVGTSTFAFVPPVSTGQEQAIRQPVWILEEPDAGNGPAAEAAAPALSRFLQEAGGRWETPLDGRTGRALLFQGSGIPLVPGAGNSLIEARLPAEMLDPSGRPTVDGIASLARSFFENHAALFMPERGSLVLNRDRSVILEDGRIASADFDWEVDGVPVLGARAFARINHGNLIQAGTRLIGKVQTPTIPALKAVDALDRARTWAGLPSDGSTIVQPGRLVLLPVAADPLQYAGPAGAGVDYRLVWEVAFRQAEAAPTWTARVDAITGEVVEFFDSNQYLGQVTGGVFPRTVIDPETIWPFPFTTVVGVGSSVTDANGRYAAPGGSVTSGLDGRFFNTNCVSCSNPAQPSVTRPFGSGLLSFGTGGLDAVGNGSSTRADRNAFYHLNVVRLVAKKWLANSYLEGTIAANVNINASCNAFYSGSVNFYRSSATCNNTGEISDVMQHEWGHGLDFATAGGDGATGEATADTVGVHVTHSNLIGPYFNRNGAPVRNLDKNTTSKGLLTRTNVISKCPSGGGPLGREVHCEGEIYGQTTWDLANALAAKYGQNTGWRESERLFFTSMPQSITYLPGQSGSIYDAYIAADDDDGNLANGTPNGGEIFTAFNTHEIAGTVRSSSPHCARPAQPVVTATPGCDQVALAWTAVPDAVSYRVQKTWQSGSTPFLDGATVSGTNYTDTQVTSGLTYRYVVLAVNSSGCESSINAETTGASFVRPSLDATGISIDDTPAGNRSGTIDPGEAVDLTLTLQNAGTSSIGTIANVLTSLTPGVTVASSSASYPTLAPGATSPGLPAYRIAIDNSLACGSPIDLILTTTDSVTGCALESIPVRIATGIEGAARASYDFEVSGGWQYDAASSTAISGAWVRGDPVGTSFQPDDDVTPGGINCWFTAANGSGIDDMDDVDGGQVVLKSPSTSLTGLSTAHLSYWRWFGQRDLGDDPTGDFFVFEASNNGGASWVPLETLGDDVSVPSWTKKEFAVERFLPLTTSMRFRVRVSDGVAAGDSGDIIEAAIDDFRITDEACDMTPPCFTAATFAGIATAQSGPSCGETDLSWAAAQSQCQNATIRYAVHRGLAPGFVVSPANEIASGLTGLTYRDRFLTPGTTYYYIVRAVDSRSGEDANTVARSAVAATGADTAAPIFPGIASGSSGASCGEATLSWAAGGESCSLPVIYRVYRSTSASFTPSPSTLIAETTSLSYTDAALSPGVSYTYIVRARDHAGNEDTNLVRRTLVATGGACAGCQAPAPVGTILVTKSGGDVVLDWTTDPVSETRYVAYKVTGPAFSQPTRIGTTAVKSFIHAQAATTRDPVFYFVSAVNACGQESAIETVP